MFFEKFKGHFSFQNKKSPCQWLVNKAIEQSNYCGFGVSDFGNVDVILNFPFLSNVPLDKRQDLVLLLPMLYEFLSVIGQ
jgi:hypothetical protein